jgi:hypothetical protein
LVAFARQTGGARVQRVVAGSLPVVQGFRPCSKWMMTMMKITMERMTRMLMITGPVNDVHIFQEGDSVRIAAL